jgi:hypothetical protein
MAAFYRKMEALEAVDRKAADDARQEGFSHCMGGPGALNLPPDLYKELADRCTAQGY